MTHTARSRATTGILMLFLLATAATSADAANLFVSPTGSDTGTCTQSRPCRSFDRAYRVAGPGEVVEVGGGSYPPQSLGAVAGHEAGAPVVFAPAAGQRVVVAGELAVFASRVEFRSMTVSDWHAKPGADHVTFRNLTAT